VWRAEGLLRGGANKGWTTVMALRQISYRAFESKLWHDLGQEIRSGAFDLVHRVTPLSPTLPSPLAVRCKRAGVPFVWGPINGGLPWPRGFDTARRREREWLSYLRGVHRLIPGYTATRSACDAIMVASRATLEQMPGRYLDRCVYIPENGIDPARFPRVARRVPTGLPLRCAFVGRLVPFKGLDMVIEAAADLMRAGCVELDVIGDGPERRSLERQADDADAAERVRFHGWLDHAHVAERLRVCHLLTFPSVREFGGGVVLEAMAAGLAPIVVDYGGPGELVSPGTGIALPIGSRAAIIDAMRRELERFVDDPTRVHEMGLAAQERAYSLFTWEAKASQVRAVYRWVLGDGAKPDFGMPLRGTTA